MVNYINPPEILKICDNLCDVLKPESSNWQALQADVRAHIHRLADAPEMGYMPSHKWLEFISGCIDHAVAIAEEHQLRSNEARAMLNQMIGKESPIYRKFKLDAALEQARYEPLMLQDTVENGDNKRELLLMKRWHAMKMAQQEHDPISDGMLEALDQSVTRAIHAPCFLNYRVGPMLQFFTEMLQTANRLIRSNPSPNHLVKLIDTDSNLWKRYALKSARFEDDTDQAPYLLSDIQPPNRPLH